MEERLCKECNDVLKGRADQKFCDNHCRTTWNNKENRVVNTYVRNINKILTKNRNILSDFTSNSKTKVHKDMLIAKGFNFDYHTYTFTNKEGKTYFYCYEQGYLHTGNDFYFLVISKDYKA